MLMQDIRRRIISGALPAGECLPSVRRYAAQMQVSPSTVMEATSGWPRRGLSFRAAGPVSL
jgi:DNA-binding transcriptional regulator YhcF (GntR family)